MASNFCLITDTHYYNAQALGLRTDRQQKTLNESGAILDAALDIFIGRKDCDVLLIAGDVSCNGERESHEELINKLRRVQAAGKRVLLITSTHDFEQQSNARRLAQGQKIGEAHTVTGEFNPGMTLRDELPVLYHEFGFSDALSVFDELSYCAQIAPGLRALMLNDDGGHYHAQTPGAPTDKPRDDNGIQLTADGHLLCGYSAEQLDWILGQIEQAHRDGEAIFAVTHHPLLPPFPLYPTISKRDMLGDYERLREILPDAGLRVIFTGHTHVHNIGHYTSAAGNSITDINTAALCGYPAPLRFCSYEDGVLDVHTECVERFVYDGKELGLDFLRDEFDRLLNDVIYSAAHDFDGFVSACRGLGLPPEKLGGHRLLVKAAGLFLEKATLGTLSRLLLCPIPKEARKVRLGGLITEALRNIFAGTEKYSPETPVGAAAQRLAGRLQKLIGKHLKGTIAEDLPALFASLLYDDSPDWAWSGRL
ncbi:MAG: metallophosphoesterase [Clostridium sp.]|nr:metallophosphoesterase [Clostridium sp.]